MLLKVKAMVKRNILSCWYCVNNSCFTLELLPSPTCGTNNNNNNNNNNNKTLTQPPEKRIIQSNKTNFFFSCQICSKQNEQKKKFTSIRCMMKSKLVKTDFRRFKRRMANKS